MKHFLWRVYIFFDLLGSYYYDEVIGIRFAWALAGAFEEHSDVLEGFEEVQP